MKNKFFVFILLCVTLCNINSIVGLNINNNTEGDIMSLTHQSTNTNNWYCGETVLIDYGSWVSFPDNLNVATPSSAEFRVFRSEYTLLTNSTIVHRLSIAYHDCQIYIPLSWTPCDNTFVSESAQMYGDDYCIDFGSVDDTVRLYIYFRSGVGYGSEYEHQAEIICAEERWKYSFEDQKTYTLTPPQSTTSYENVFGFSDYYSSSTLSQKGVTTVNHTIVSEGGSSLLISPILVSGWYRGYVDLFLPYGSWLVGFKHFITDENYTFDNLVVQKSTDGAGTWETIYSLPSTPNRWISNKFYVSIEYTYYTQLRFYINDASDYSLFFDEFYVYSACSVIKTSNYHENILTNGNGCVGYWLEPSILSPISDNITVEIRIRDNNTIVYSIDIDQDSTYYYASGKFSITIPYSEWTPDQCEYEIRVICRNSWFGWYPYDYFTESDTSETVYSDGDSDSWNSTIKETEDESFCVTHDPSIAGEIGTFYIELGSSKNLFDFDYLVYSHSRSSDQIIQAAYELYFMDITYSYMIEMPTASYTNLKIDYLTTFYRDLTVDPIYSDMDEDDIQVIAVSIRYVSDRSSTWYTDSVRFIITQKSYFTPQLIDYSNDYNTYNFSEGDTDGFTTSWGSSSVENGYIKTTPDGSKPYSYIYISSLNINADYYDYFLIRLKQTATSYETLRYTINDYDGNTIGSTQSFSSTSWVLFELDASSDSDWSSTESKITLKIYNNNGSNLSSDFDYYVDFISLVNPETFILYESTDYFYLSSSNNSYISYISQDNNLYSDYLQDLDLIWKNKSIGHHNISYIVFNDINEFGCYIPTDLIVYSYSSEATTPSVTIDTTNHSIVNSEILLSIDSDYDLSGYRGFLYFKDINNVTIKQIDLGYLSMTDNNSIVTITTPKMEGVYTISLTIIYGDQILQSNDFILLNDNTDQEQEIDKRINIDQLASVLFLFGAALVIWFFYSSKD